MRPLSCGAGDDRSSAGHSCTQTVDGTEHLSSGGNEMGGIDQGPTFSFPTSSDCELFDLLLKQH